MKTRFTGLFLVVAAVATTAFTSLDVAKLVWKPQKGSVAKYDVVDVFETQFAKISYEYTSVETVEEVTAGKVVLVLERSEPKTKADGPTGCPMGIARHAKLTYALNGQYLDTEMERYSPLAARLGNMTALILPSKPLKTGDVWTHKVQSDANTNTRAATATFKLVGSEQIGKWQTYKISFEYEETEGSEWERMSATGTKWISMEDGTLVQEQLKIGNLPGALESLTSELKRIE